MAQVVVLTYGPDLVLPGAGRGMGEGVGDSTQRARAFHKVPLSHIHIVVLGPMNISIFDELTQALIYKGENFETMQDNEQYTLYNPSSWSLWDRYWTDRCVVVMVFWQRMKEYGQSIHLAWTNRGLWGGVGGGGVSCVSCGVTARQRVRTTLVPLAHRISRNPFWVLGVTRPTIKGV